MVSGTGYAQGYGNYRNYKVPGNTDKNAACGNGQHFDYGMSLGGRKASGMERTSGSIQNDGKKSAVLSDSSNRQHTAQQAACFGARYNKLMETFEMMQTNGSDSEEEHIIEDPFGLVRKEMSAPYASYADKNGVINYNGVKFTMSGSWLCLGDTSDMKNVIRIPFGKGRGLMVNRNNITELGRAISMFSPEEQGMILRALQLDSKIREVQEEIEEMGDDVGKQSTEEKAAEPE